VTREGEIQAEFRLGLLVDDLPRRVRVEIGRDGIAGNPTLCKPRLAGLHTARPFNGERLLKMLPDGKVGFAALCENPFQQIEDFQVIPLCLEVFQDKAFQDIAARLP
jgi:hypothetical protein